jgi:hypothetical protein
MEATATLGFALRHWPVYISNSSRYDKRHWSVFERILAGHTHCTNGVEGIHHHLNTLLPRRGIATCDVRSYLLPKVRTSVRTHLLIDLQGFQELRLLEDKTRRQYIRYITTMPRSSAIFFIREVCGFRSILPGPKGFVPMLRGSKKRSDFPKRLREIVKEFSKLEKPEDSDIRGCVCSVVANTR